MLPTMPSATWAESHLDTRAPGRLAFDLFDALCAPTFETFCAKAEALGATILPGSREAIWPSEAALLDALTMRTRHDSR